MAYVSDDDLMSRYAGSDDRAAFEELFRRHAPRLFGYFRRLGASDAAAQDLVQQTFMQMHRARRDFREGAPLRPWLYTIAANLRRDASRHALRRPETPLDTSAVEPSIAPETSSPSDRLVRRALAALPDGQREVVVLHWYEGYSFTEIAAILGLGHSAVKVRAHRAYQRLRDELDPDLKPLSSDGIVKP